MRVIVAALLLLASASAWSADNGFYLGAGVTQVRFDEDNLDFGDLTDQLEDVDDEDTSFKIIAGFRFIDFFGVEANYLDFGEATAELPLVGELFAEAKGASAFAVGYLPIGLVVDLFAKAGVVYTEVEAGGGDFEFDDESTELAYGAGAQARLGSLAVRLEYEKFEVGTDVIDDLDLLSLGLTWTFL